MDILFDRVDFRCTVCNAKSGTCDCWTRCSCGWSYRKGTKCSNLVHRPHITLECPLCHKSAIAPRQRIDPKRATRLVFPCETCRPASGETPTAYFDAKGDPVSL